MIRLFKPIVCLLIYLSCSFPAALQAQNTYGAPPAGDYFNSNGDGTGENSVPDNSELINASGDTYHILANTCQMSSQIQWNLDQNKDRLERNLGILERAPSTAKVAALFRESIPILIQAGICYQEAARLRNNPAAKAPLAQGNMLVTQASKQVRQAIDTFNSLHIPYSRSGYQPPPPLNAQKNSQSGSEKPPQTLRISPEIWYHQPILAAQKLRARAESLMQHRKLSPYSLEATPKGFPKCNLFVYDVMETAGVPIPRGKNGRRLPVRELDPALAHDDNFEKVWTRNPNESNWAHEKSRYLKDFRAQDADISIWNNKYLEHVGILEETIDGYGNTYYAGRDELSGLGYGYLKSDWIESRTKGYGAPDAVYRYKHFIGR